jgi:hypothetical protein
MFERAYSLAAEIIARLDHIIALLEDLLREKVE